MQGLMPCLWMEDQAEEAARFYTSLFDNSKIDQITHYGEATSKASGHPRGQVMTVVFQLEGQHFMTLNGGPHFTKTPAVSLFIHCRSKQEIESLWKQLSDGGSVLMPLDSYPFSEKYGWVEDKFGVSWQLILKESEQKFAPCFLFVGDHYGQAEEAMNFYISQFDNSRTVELSHYGAGQHGDEGTVAYAKFTLAGQEFVVMDGPGEHKFSITPGISIIVNCDSQAEIDRYWEDLSSGGNKSQCGWLGDRFGVAWQIAPARMGEWLQDGTSDQAERVMSALLEMNKLDIARLENAARPVSQH